MNNRHHRKPIKYYAKSFNAIVPFWNYLFD